jgi:hypothetical protein
VIVFGRIILWLLADLVGLVALSVRSRRSVGAENLFLRRELALYRERGIKPRRVDAATRVSLADAATATHDHLRRLSHKKGRARHWYWSAIKATPAD